MDVVTMPATKIGISIYLLKIDQKKEQKSNFLNDCDQTFSFKLWS